MTSSNPLQNWGKSCRVALQGLCFGGQGSPDVPGQRRGSPMGSVPSQPLLLPPLAWGTGEGSKIPFVHRWPSQNWLIDIQHGNWISKYLQESCEEAAGLLGRLFCDISDDGANELDPTTYGEICLLCTKMSRKMRFLLKISQLFFPSARVCSASIHHPCSCKGNAVTPQTFHLNNKVNIEILFSPVAGWFLTAH